MRQDDKKENQNRSYLRENEISTAQRARYRLANENVKKVQKKRKRIAIIIVLLSCVVALIAVDLIFFNIKEIEVSGNSMYSTEVILSELGIKEGTNLLAIHRGTLEGRLEKKFPGIEKADVKVKLPDKLKVALTESTPLIYIAVGEYYYTLDKNMVVLEKASNYDEGLHQSLVRVYFPDIKECIVGNYIKTEDDDVSEMLKKLVLELTEKELMQEVKEINILNKFDIQFVLGTKYTVKLGNIIDCDIKLEFLKGILEELSEDDVGTIDISDSDIREAIFRRA